MRFVPIKNVEQQDVQNLHSVRQRIIKEKIALGNQIRGILGEYGIAIAKGFASMKKRVPEVLEDADNELTYITRKLIAGLIEEFKNKEQLLEKCTKEIEQLCQSNEACERIKEIKGIGSITATLLIAKIGNAKNFKKGRDLAAHLGLVPVQHSSGEKHRLGKISKEQDNYIRTLLIHGARSVVTHAAKKIDPLSMWIKQLGKTGVVRP